MASDSKNILVLGAIEAFCDIVRDIEDKGFNAVCCDYYEHAAAKQISSCSYLVSTTDVEKMVEIGKRHKVIGVITAFSDRNLRPSLEICRSLNLPIYYSEEIIDLLTDKINMKNHFRKNGFPVIPYKVVNREFCNDELDGLKYPLILKPIDGYGSKGIIKCHSIREVRNHLGFCLESSQKYSDKFLVEEFYEADEFSASGWVKDGKCYLTSTYDVGRNFEESVVLSYVAFPSKYEKGYKREIKNLMQDLTESIGIKEGPITVQCYIGSQGLKVGEYLYRLAGGSPYLYSVELGGPNISKMLIDLQIGNKIDYQNLMDYENTNEDTYYDVMVFASKEGRLHFGMTMENLLGHREIERVLVYHFDSEYLYDVPSKGTLVMRIFYHQDKSDKREYKKILDELRSLIEIKDDIGEDITTLRYPEKNYRREIDERYNKGKW